MSQVANALGPVMTLGLMGALAFLGTHLAGSPSPRQRHRLHLERLRLEALHVGALHVNGAHGRHRHDEASGQVSQGD